MTLTGLALVGVGSMRHRPHAACVLGVVFMLVGAAVGRTGFHTEPR
jgi:hypothetical protein